MEPSFRRENAAETLREFVRQKNIPFPPARNRYRCGRPGTDILMI
jgi:hypothetical protein